jgi:hypothetical protein
MRHHTHWAAGTAAAVLLLAGCGGSGGPTGSSANAGAPAGSPHQIAGAAYRFAACMRAHGLGGFPDPVVHASGDQVSVMIHLPGSLHNSPAFKGAQTACQGILPGPKGGGNQSGHAPVADELSFARCIRSHGFNRFPDPNAQGRLDLPMIQSSGVDVAAPSFRTAALACVPASHGALTTADVERGLAQLIGGQAGAAGAAAGPSGG